MANTNRSTSITRQQVEATLSPKYVGNTTEKLLKMFDSVTVSRRNEDFFTHQILCNDEEENPLFIIRYGWNDKTNQWVYEVLD